MNAAAIDGTAGCTRAQRAIKCSAAAAAASSECRAREKSGNEVSKMLDIFCDTRYIITARGGRAVVLTFGG